MDKKDIHLSDFHRILFGEAPDIFLLEVFLRTTAVYLFLLVVTRWLGKRMTGQLSITEMAVMLTLGAIVSVSMQMPESGVLMAVVVLFCTLSFERGISWLEFKNRKIEQVTQGTLSILIEDGVIQYKTLQSERISHQQLFATLRSGGIYHLGMVKRVYLEASRLFSVYKNEEELPGLPTLPDDDDTLKHRFKQAGLVVCTYCGLVKQTHERSACSHCSHDDYTVAVTNITPAS